MQDKRIRFRLSIILLAVVFFTVALPAKVKAREQTDPKLFNLSELATMKKIGSFCLPQLTTKQRDALDLESNLTATGLINFNTNTECWEFWRDGHWVSNKVFQS